MANHYVADISQPFYLAGRKVSAVTFVVGEEWVKIDLNRCEVDRDGAAVVRMLPEQARQLARALLANADKDQVKQHLMLPRKAG